MNPDNYKSYPGPGDECTWPPCSGQPGDPRNVEPTEEVEEEKEVDNLIQFFVHGIPRPGGSKRAIPIYRGKRGSQVWTGKTAVIDSSGQHGPTGFTWRNNILSMGKLREKWNEGKIFIGMTKPSQSTERCPVSHGSIEEMYK